MANALDWFEIPVSDIEKARKFYEAILDQELISLEVGPDYVMAMFPAGEGEVSGAIIQGEGYTPATEGSIIYLNGGDDLSVVLDRVEAAGGQIVTPKMDIGEYGFTAFFIDNQGNKVGLHSMG